VEQAEAWAGSNWVNLGSELDDFGTTAAVIESLDLVICVDTSVAHLAGAMAKPVWVLLAKPSDFRWMEDREDSPWYPTMRLFRQKERGVWSDVIERVREALMEQVRSGSPALWVKKPFVALKPALPQNWIAGVTKLPGHRPGFSAVAETRGGLLQYLPDEPFVGDALAWYGEYLQLQIDFLERVVVPGSTVLEVGAGIGAHALALAQMVGAEGHLMLYEDDAGKRRILGQNLGLHKISQVTVMRRRLGQQREVESGERERPEQETLDDLQLERLDWIKINDSGRLEGVIGGGSETLWRLRPKLMLSGMDQMHVKQLAITVKDYGYRCWENDTPLYNPENFNRRESSIFGSQFVPMLLAIPEEIDIDIDLELPEI
jgi:hypothetical protein